MVKRRSISKLSAIAATAALAMAVGCSKGDDASGKQAPAKPVPATDTAPAKVVAAPAKAAVGTAPTVADPVAMTDAKVLALKFHHDS